MAINSHKYKIHFSITANRKIKSLELEEINKDEIM